MSPRTKEQNAEIRNTTKQTIANSAMVLFMEDGYLNVTIDQIAKKAEVSKGLMYNYFSGKEDLLQFIINRIFEKMSEFSEEISSVDDPVEKIESLIHNSLKLMKEKSDFWKTIMPIITQKAISSKMESRLRAVFMGLTKEMEEMFRACGVKNAKIEAYQLGALLDGIAWNYFFLFKGDYPIEHIEKQLLIKYRKLLGNGRL